MESFWLMTTHEAGLTAWEVSDGARGQDTAYEVREAINMVIPTNFYGLFPEHKETTLFKKTTILTAQK